ncbi:hypothetical protein ACFLYO_02525 [Chloroflexota bacterium]
MKTRLFMFVCFCVVLSLLFTLLPLTVFAQGKVTPTPAPAPSEDAAWVEYAQYRYQAPPDWLTWVLDPAASEQNNETALLNLVRQIDPAAVAEAQPVIEDNIPGFVSVALAPQLVGDDLMFVTMSEYSLTVSIGDLDLNANATDQQILEALGVIVPDATADSSFGYWLEQDEYSATVSMVYLVPQTDALLIMNGSVSNAMVGDLQLSQNPQTVVAAVDELLEFNDAFQQLVAIPTSLELIDDSAVTGPPDKNVPTANTAPTGASDLSQCPNAINLGELSAANTNLYMPFRLPAQFAVGTVNVAALDPQPLELEPTPGSDFVFPLSGYITAADCPDAYFTASPCPDPLQCFVSIMFTAAGASNPTLLVLQPDGQYVFADIVQPGGNLDPAVAARPASNRTIPGGIYQVWVGGHQPGEIIAGELLVIVQ